MSKRLSITTNDSDGPLINGIPPDFCGTLKVSDAIDQLLGDVTAKDTRIAELEAALTERDTEIARLKDALDLSALEYADLAVSAKSLEEHLHTKPLPP